MQRCDYCGRIIYKNVSGKYFLCSSKCKTKFKNKVIILSAIDNLIKGGAGQAIQNMNLRFGLNDNEGLK